MTNVNYLCGFSVPNSFDSELIIKTKTRGKERGGNFSPNTETALFVNVMGS